MHTNAASCSYVNTLDADFTMKLDLGLIKNTRKLFRSRLSVSHFDQALCFTPDQHADWHAHLNDGARRPLALLIARLPFESAFALSVTSSGSSSSEL